MPTSPRPPANLRPDYLGNRDGTREALKADVVRALATQEQRHDALTCELKKVILHQERERAALEGEVKLLATRLEKQTEMTATVSSELMKAISSSTELTSFKHSAELTLSSVRSQRDELALELEEARKAVAGAATSAAAHEAHAKAHDAQVADLVVEVERLRLAADAAAADAARLDTCVQHGAAKLQQAAAENAATREQLREKTAAWQLSVESAAQLQRRNMALDEDVARLQELLRAAQAQEQARTADSEETCSQLRALLAEKDAALAASCSDAANLRSAKERLACDFAACQAKASALSDDYRLKEDAVSAMQEAIGSKVEVLEAQLHVRDAELAELREQLASVRQEAEEAAGFRRDFQEECAKRAALESRLGAVGQAAAAARQEADGVRQEAEGLRGEREMLKAERLALAEQLRSVGETADTATTRLKEERDAARAQLQEAAERRDAAEEGRAAVAQEKADTEQRLAEAAGTVAQLEETLAAVSGELEQSREAADSNGTRVSALSHEAEEAGSALEAARNVVEGLTRRCEDLDKNNAALQEAVERLTTQHELDVRQLALSQDATARNDEQCRNASRHRQEYADQVQSLEVLLDKKDFLIKQLTNESAECEVQRKRLHDMYEDVRERLDGLVSERSAMETRHDSVLRDAVDRQTASGSKRLRRQMKRSADLLKSLNERRMAQHAFNALAGRHRRAAEPSACTRPQKESRADVLRVISTRLGLHAAWTRLRLHALNQRANAIVGTATEILSRGTPMGSLFDMCQIAVQGVEDGRLVALLCAELKAEVANSLQLRRDAQADFDLHNLRMQDTIEKLSNEILGLTSSRKDLLGTITHLSALLHSTCADLRMANLPQDMMRALISNFAEAAERTETVIASAHSEPSVCGIYELAELPTSIGTESPRFSPTRMARLSPSVSFRLGSHGHHHVG